MPNRLNREFPAERAREGIRDRYHLPPYRLRRERLSVLCEGRRHTRDRGTPIVHESSHGPRLSDDEKARRASPREATSRGDDSFRPRLSLHPSELPATHWRPRTGSVHVPSGQLSRQRTDRIVLRSFEGLCHQPFVRINRGGPRDSRGLHQLLQLRARSMEPKKDDPETISEPSDRSVENLVFLLNCPFYGAQFIKKDKSFLIYTYLNKWNSSFNRSQIFYRNPCAYT